MNRADTTAPKSKVTVPQRCHPAARLVFAEMRRQGVTYDELEWRSGVQRTTFKAWRTHNRPGLETIAAALGALGYEFLPVPRLDKLPDAVRERLREAAAEWGREEDLVPQLILEIAHRTLDTVGHSRGRCGTNREGQ